MSSSECFTSKSNVKDYKKLMDFIIWARNILLAFEQLVYSSFTL